MKRFLLILPLVFMAGCMSARVPETSITKTPFGDFEMAKDMEIEIEGLSFQRDTNGVVTLTAKTIRSKSKNNPKVISASAAQDKVFWDGMKEVASGASEGAVRAFITKQP